MEHVTCLLTLWLLLEGCRQSFCWNLFYPEERNNDVGGEERTNGSWLIFPGTKWCGSGNVAQNYDDLGPQQATDACCRQHDSCPDLIESGHSEHGLSNDAFYTRLNCECDEKFYRCLKKADTLTSQQVGVTYFNVLGTQCFREDHPIIRCKKYSPILKKRCVEYELDDSAPVSYQWFHVPVY